MHRPVIIGALPLEYHLAIYNREGQLVFTTRDATEGWDGRVRGIPSVRNTFVWYARYRLPGEPERTEDHFQNIIRPSTLISGAGGKERHKFFNLLCEKITANRKG